MTFLRNHPFAVKAHFDYSLVLTYAVPAARIPGLIPPCVTLDTFDEQWAFVAVAMVKTRALRPALLPHFLGQNFFLIGHRVFVRYQTAAGKWLRGLYILRSATDGRAMNVLGAVLTRYQYQKIDVIERYGDHKIRVASQQADLDIRVHWENASPSLPRDSPFPDWKTARRFAGPLPFTFSYTPEAGKVLIVEGRRDGWTPQPVNVSQAAVRLPPGLDDAVLASAFVVRDIDYFWKKGRAERWPR